MESQNLFISWQHLRRRRRRRPSFAICTQDHIHKQHREMHIPGLVPDIYSFLNFAFTVFFITLGFYFILQCQCTDFVDEEDDFFDAESYFDSHLRYLNHLRRDRGGDSDTNTDTTDTDRDRYTDTDTDTDRDYYPVPSAPPVRDYCLACGDWSTQICGRCKVARYCSDDCRIKHWRESHELDCKEYTSPGNIGSARAGSSEERSSRHRVYEVPTRKKQSSKRKSGKEHRSVVECPICLTAIHTYKHSRPSLSCEICNQKFHSQCISQWFSTSKKSSCPTCRKCWAPGQSSSSSK